MENKEIQIGKKIYIRQTGKDEYWLQDLIYDNPSILGLGDLIPLNKEKKQSSGGRLDILLKNPEDNSMYEVEVMLGETDPSHIIRCIEYWDIEKRKYPQRQHYPVLIAENFNRRYFNVIQVLSLNVPMIAIQADMLEVGNQKIINFTKILDIYEEISEEENEGKIVNEASWVTNSKWTLNNAKELQKILESENIKFTLNYTQNYVSLIINGKGNAYWLYKKSDPKSHLGFKEKDVEKIEAIKTILDTSELTYNYNKYNEFYIYLDAEILKTKKEIFKQINAIRYKVGIIETDE
jgi:hypothetical protein